MLDQRERQVAVRDGGAVGALLGGALGVDVDPLVVAGDVGELVDVLLRDLEPLGPISSCSCSIPST